MLVKGLKTGQQNVSCVKVRLKGKGERRSGKGNPSKKEMNNMRIFMTSHMTLSIVSLKQYKIIS